MLAAARALADFVTPEQIEQGQIYPEAKDLRACAATVRHLVYSTTRACFVICKYGNEEARIQLEQPQRGQPCDEGFNCMYALGSEDLGALLSDMNHRSERQAMWLDPFVTWLLRCISHLS